jgi:hypothetical protein
MKIDVRQQFEIDEKQNKHQILQQVTSTNSAFSFAGIWKGIVPPKVEIFCWMAIINRINTQCMLVRRGILGSS